MFLTQKERTMVAFAIIIAETEFRDLKVIEFLQTGDGTYWRFHGESVVETCNGRLVNANSLASQSFFKLKNWKHIDNINL